MYDVAWHILRRLVVDLAVGVSGWGAFKLSMAALGQGDTKNWRYRFVRFGGAIALGAFTVWLFFALHPWWRW